MRHFKITMSILLSLSLTIFAACGGNSKEDPLIIKQSDAVNDCGGFAVTRTPTFDDYPGAYCDAEVLHWEYDALNQKLDIRDARLVRHVTDSGGLHQVWEGELDLAEDSGFVILNDTVEDTWCH